MRLKIMTYNVQSGRDAWGQLHLDGCAATINEVQPDVCVLNEVRVGCIGSGRLDQPAEIGKATGMYHAFAKAIPFDGGSYGIALLSKYPIVKFEVFPVPALPEETQARNYEARVLERAELDINGQTIVVYGSHFGLTGRERVNATKLVLEKVPFETLPTLLMGDFNMTPDDSLIAQLEEKLINTGKDSLELTHHTLNMRDTIDYIFVNDKIKVTASYVKFSYASDHLPRIIECEIK